MGRYLSHWSVYLASFCRAVRYSPQKYPDQIGTLSEQIYMGLQNSLSISKLICKLCTS